MPRRVLAPLLLYAGLTAIALAPLWPRDRVFGYRDLLVYFLPMRLFARQSLLAGAWPVRNPFIACGNPFFANPETQLLYPPAWGYLLLGLRGGSVVFYASSLMIGAAGAHLLARRLGARPTAAACAGVVFGFSGFAFSSFEVQNVMCDRLVPLALFAALLVREAPTARRIALLCAVESFLLFGGEPSILAATHLLVVLILLAVPGGLRRKLGLPVVATLLLVMASAVQLVPTVSYVLESERWAGFGREDLAQWQLAPLEMLELAIPGLPHGPLPGKVLGAQTYLRTVYVGVVALVLLAGRALSGRIRREEKLVAACGGLFLALALGTATPLYALYAWLTLRTVRYPVRFATFVTLAVALLVALAIERLAAAAAARRRAGAALAAVGVIHLLFPLARGWLSAPVGENLAAAGIRGGMLLLGAAVVTVLPPARVGALLPPLLAFVLAADALGAPGRDHLYTVPASALESPRCDAPWMAPLEGGSFRVMPVVVPSASLARTIAMPPDEQPEDVQQNPFALSAMPCGVRSAAVEPVIPLSSYGRFIDAAMREVPLLGRASVRVVLLPEPRTARLAPRPLPARPRFSFARRALAEGEERAALQALARLPLDTVMVDGVPPEGELPKGSIDVSIDEPTRIALRIATASPGLLVVTERQEPGWGATIDGSPSPIRRCDRQFMAIDVPGGPHRVEMTYHPPGLRMAAAISMLTWTLMLGCSAVGGRAPALPGAPSCRSPA